MWNYVRLAPSAAEVLDKGEGLENPIDVAAAISHWIKFVESEICSRGHFCDFEI